MHQYFFCTHSDRHGEAGRSHSTQSTHGPRGPCVTSRGNCAQCTTAPPRTFHSVAPGYHRYERTQRESEYFACNCTQCRNLGTSMDICCQGRHHKFSSHCIWMNFFKVRIKVWTLVTINAKKLFQCLELWHFIQKKCQNDWSYTINNSQTWQLAGKRVFI